MEKSQSLGEAPEIQKEGIFPATKQGTNEVDLGEVLELELDPEEASRVRRKLDLMYTPPVPLFYTFLTVYSLLPLMCFAYFLQFVDKLVLSQATLFNLREDLVSYLLFQPFSPLSNRSRTCKETSIRGPRPSSTSGISHGAGPTRI